MKLCTRSISILLALAAAVTSLPVSALAADVEEIETASVEEVEIADVEENLEYSIIGEDEIDFEPTIIDTEADPVGTNPIVLTSGVQATSQIPYDSSKNYNDGHNYKDFSIYVPTDGTLKITFDVSIGLSNIQVFSDYTKEQIGMNATTTAGERNKCYCETVNLWNSTAGIYSGVYTCNVTKGTYLIRVSRKFCDDYYDTHYDDYHKGKYGTDGNGKMHIIAEMEKPSCPTDIEINKATSSSLTIDWVGPDNATSYDVRYKTGSGSWKTISKIVDNTVTIKNLKPSTTYTYQVRTRAGEIIGDWSKSVNAKTSATPAPQNVQASKNNKRITLSWNAVNGATGYIIKSADGKTQYTKSAIKTNYYTITGLKNGKQYQFKVYAYVGGKWYGSNRKSATPSAAPQNVNATAGSKKITLSWTKVNGATGYIVKSADGKIQYTKSAIKNNSYTVTGLKGKTQYKFKVYAKVDEKWYASNPKTKTTKA